MFYKSSSSEIKETSSSQIVRKIYDPKLKRIPSVLALKDELNESFLKKFEIPIVKEVEEGIKLKDITVHYDFSIPSALYWSSDEILIWLREGLELPQYASTFLANKITGKLLLTLHADRLVLMNIHDFDHIKKITSSIKHIFDVEFEGYDDNDISMLHPKVLRYKYLLMKGRTGEKYETLTPYEFMVQQLMAVPIVVSDDCIWLEVDPGRKKVGPKLKSARTGTKRLPGHPKDPKLTITFADLNRKHLIVNEHFKFKSYLSQYQHTK